MDTPFLVMCDRKVITKTTNEVNEMTYKQNKEIIKTIINELDLSCDWLNNVLSSDKLVNREGERVDLWLHFGYIKVVTKENKDNRTRAGGMCDLEEFTIEEDGSIIIYSSMRKEQGSLSLHPQTANTTTEEAKDLLFEATK